MGSQIKEWDGSILLLLDVRQQQRRAWVSGALVTPAVNLQPTEAEEGREPMSMLSELRKKQFGASKPCNHFDPQ